MPRLRKNTNDVLWKKKGGQTDPEDFRKAVLIECPSCPYSVAGGQGTANVPTGPGQS